MPAEVWFRYVPGGTLYPYRVGYNTMAEAKTEAGLVATTGFWYQRPDLAQPFSLPQAISAAITRPAKKKVT